jgi:GAF domain-containing protein
MCIFSPKDTGGAMKASNPPLEEIITQMESFAAEKAGADKCIHSCIDLIFETMRAERGFVLLLGRITGAFRAFAAHNVDLENLMTTEEISQTIINVVREDEKPLLTTDAMEDPRFSSKVSVILSQIRSVICAPLSSEKGFFGLIYLDSRVAKSFFMLEDLDYLAACAEKLSEMMVRLYPDIVYEKKG